MEQKKYGLCGFMLQKANFGRELAELIFKKYEFKVGKDFVVRCKKNLWSGKYCSKTVQRDNDPKHKAQATFGSLKNKKENVLQYVALPKPSYQSHRASLALLEHLYPYTSSNRPELLGSKYAWKNGQKSKQCAKLADAYPKRFKAFFPAKGGSNKY